MAALQGGSALFRSAARCGCEDRGRAGGLQAGEPMQPTMLRASTSSSTPPAGSRRPLDGYEFVLDADQLGMWHAFKCIDLSENGQAMDAFLTNSPGGFLRHPHTLANFESKVASVSRRTELRAAERGREGCAARANAIRVALAEYEAPRSTTPGGLREWIDRRKASFPTRASDGRHPVDP
jgi:hypothetical protein